MIIVLIVIFGLMVSLILAQILLQLGFFYLAMGWAIFCLILACFLIVLYLFEAYRVLFLRNAPYVRSSTRLVQRIIDEVDFKEQALVYDLGCGDGKFIRQLVKTKKVRVIGYEYFLVPYLIGVVINFFSKDKINIRYEDFFKADFKNVDYIFCFLMPKQMSLLETKFKKELKPGALVISNTFAFANWAAEKIITLKPRGQKGLSSTIYFYRQPSRTSD